LRGGRKKPQDYRETKNKKKRAERDSNGKQIALGSKNVLNVSGIKGTQGESRGGKKTKKKTPQEVRNQRKRKEKEGVKKRPPAEQKIQPKRHNTQKSCIQLGGGGRDSLLIKSGWERAFAY